MLKFLAIRDFVIVSSLELDFSSGFTALTGETGAGKSILIDALSLALGERGDAAMVRNGCERAEIAAEFDITALPHLQTWLAGQDLAGDENVCLLRRVLEVGGRSRGFINGRSATLQQLREAGEQLLDIHGQHAHQSLLRPDMQRELLQFQRGELHGLSFSAAEWNETQADHARLAHAASLLETAALGIEILGESDTACLAQLNALTARLRDGMAHDASLDGTLQMLESAQAELQEAVYALRHYQQRLDNDPQRLHELEQRIRSVMDAARKYRVAPEHLEEALQRIETRLAELDGDADLAELARQEQAAQQSYLGAAQKLSAGRKRAAGKLVREITAAMQTLAMQGGSFAVALSPF